MKSVTWFAGLTEIPAIKKEYHRLALLHHPDRGGSTATMQSINAAYHAALQRNDGAVSENAEGQEFTYRYNAEREQSVIDFLDKLMASGALSENVRCFLVGTWVWVEGDTRPVKSLLKALKMLWHPQRVMWYWRPPGKRSRFAKDSSFDDLADAYGITEIKGNRRGNAPALA